jgi:hypothetical protein
MLGKNLVEFESIDEYNELKKIPSSKAIIRLVKKNYIECNFFDLN